MHLRIVFLFYNVDYCLPGAVLTCSGGSTVVLTDKIVCLRKSLYTQNQMESSTVELVK